MPVPAFSPCLPSPTLAAIFPAPYAAVPLGGSCTSLTRRRMMVSTAAQPSVAVYIMSPDAYVKLLPAGC